MRSVIRTNIDRIIVVLLIPMLFGCVPDSGRTSEGGSVISDAELAGVRDLFENRYSELYSADAEGVFYPGDFSLQWEDAKKMEGNSYVDYYVPIHSEYYITALRSKFVRGRSITRKISVSQYVCIRQKTDVDGCGLSVVSSIPDVAAQNRHFWQRNYSGVIVLSSISTGVVLSMREVVDGKIVRVAFRLRGESQDSRFEDTVRMILRNTIVHRHRRLVTKSGEDWMYEGDYTYIGDGIYWDGEDGYYYDSDGDGIPESMYVESSEVNGGDGGGDGDDGWSGWGVGDDDPFGDGGYDPFGDDNNHSGDGLYDPDEYPDDPPETGGGGNTTGGSVNISSVPITGDSSVSDLSKMINNMRSEMQRQSNRVPLISNLFDKIDLSKVSIKIVETCVDYNGRSFDFATALTVPLGDRHYEIQYKALYAEYPNAIYEEFLHVYQYQCEGNSWTTGDKEFEAKVFDAVLYIDYGLYTGADKDDVSPLYDYFNNPSALTYGEALSILFSPRPYAYDRESFPISDNIDYNERIKHIK